MNALRRPLTPIAIACLLALHPLMGMASEPVPVQALPLGSPITVDGRLDEPGWQVGPWYTGFHILNRPTETAAVQTRFKVRFDLDHLYVAIEADEPHPDQVRAEVSDRDGPVSRDDCLEVMVDATGDRVEYYHFIINPAGALYDAQLRQGGHVRSVEWNSTATAASHVAADHWSAELAIPLVELALTPASTGDWALNVTRERRVGGTELSTYAPMTGGFHQATLYPRLHLAGADLGRFLWDLPYPHAGRVVADSAGALEFVTATRVTNGTGVDRPIQVRARLGARTGPWVLARLGAGAPQDLEVRVPDIGLGPQMLRLELAAAGSTAALLAVRQTEVFVEYQPLAVRVLRPFYRNTIYATEEVGEITFEVRSDLPGSELQKLVLQSSLQSVEAGSPVAATGVRPFQPYGSLSLPPAGLAVGQYDLEVSLVDPRTGETRYRAAERLRKLPPVADEWRLDENLVLRHNGDPVLPFGWFSMPPEDMADTSHAYTLMQAYSSYWQSVEQVREFLDRVAAAGTAATISPYPYPEFVTPSSIWGKPLTAREEEDLRGRIRALKDHPGLFAWYMADEPELRPALPERCRRIYEIVRDEDPHHPCIMLNDTEAGIYKYREGGDVLMPDPYPLFLQGGLAARPLEKVGRFVDAALDAGQGRLAAWVTPQGFNYGDYGQENNRGPRLLELRNQLYQAAVHGARGFLWYTYSQVPNYPDLDIGMRWLSREVADLKPYLLAPVEEADIAIEAPWPEHVHAALRRAGAHLVVMVVSTATEAQEVTVSMPALDGVGPLHVVSESRTVPVRGAAMRDRFGVYETHIYTTDPALGARQNIAEPTAAIARADAARRKPGNLAFEDSGVRVEVSSESQYGSTPGRLTDGATGGMRWRDGTPGEYPDWVQLAWPREQHIGRLLVYSDGIASLEAQVPAPDGAWRTVGSFSLQGTGAASEPLEVRLDRPATTTRLRLLIAGNRAGQDHTIVYEVEAYAD